MLLTKKCQETWKKEIITKIYLVRELSCEFLESLYIFQFS